MAKSLYPIFPVRFFGYGAPEASEGVDGQIKVEIASGTIYGKADGTWSSIAQLTPSGFAGVADTAFRPIFPLILFGSAPPGPGFGVEGQPFIDTLGGGFYGLAGGIWSLLGTFTATGLAVSPVPLFDVYPLTIFGPGPQGVNGQPGQFYIDSLAQQIQVNTGFALTIGTASGGGPVIDNTASADLSNPYRSLQPFI